MDLDKALGQTVAFAKPDSFKNFQNEIPVEWVEDALKHVDGFASMRRRRLPADQVIWLVLGMALFRDRPILEVVDKLDLSLPDLKRPSMAPSAIPQARARLGDEPMAWLFSRCASEWAHRSADGDRWRGLAIYGVDGSSFRVPDTVENREHFGGHRSNRGDSGYPLARVVALMALRSHLLAGVRFGPHSMGETTYARELWREVPANSLTIVDRGFFNARMLVPLAAQGDCRHWLTRAKKNTSWKVIEHLGPGDDIVELEVTKTARQQDPSLPRTWKVRTIQYQKQGFQPQTLVTSMLDNVAFPKTEIVPLYHERWELELGYDEIKTEMLEREETIRSKTVMGVNQELWGLFLVYNLVRLEMEKIANQEKIAPTRISFVMALRLIQDEMLWCSLSSPGAIPKHLNKLRADIKRFILPPRRSERAYPRAVKIKMSSYVKKKNMPIKESLN